MLSLDIKFGSNYQKNQWNVNVGGQFGDLFSAAVDIGQKAKEHNISGNVSIKGFQQGGDPGQLAKILAKDSEGGYYAMDCSLQNMDACKNAAKGLLDYANNNFTN